MKTALPESIFLYQNILTEGQRSSVEEILEEINANMDSYSTDRLWEVDKEIGGIGGYCMPCDPKRNLFHGEYRELFRSLQYARSEIEIANVHLHSRYVITNSGLHLEAVVRLVLGILKRFGNLRYRNATLGRGTDALRKEGIIPKDLIDGLFSFVKMYNKSKHEVNQDEDRERLFMPSDAIVGYLSARIMGYRLLSSIGHDSANHFYEIDKSKFSGLSQ